MSAEQSRKNRPKRDSATGKGNPFGPPEQLLRPEVVKTALGVAEAIFSDDDGPPPVERLDWLGRELDDFLERIGPEGRFGYLLTLRALSVLGPLLSGSLTPLSRMPLAQRTEALSRVEGSRFSGALLAVKAMLCIIYYEHPDAARLIGFDGECLRAGGES